MLKKRSEVNHSDIGKYYLWLGYYLQLVGIRDNKLKFIDVFSKKTDCKLGMTMSFDPTGEEFEEMCFIQLRKAYNEVKNRKNI